MNGGLPPRCGDGLGRHRVPPVRRLLEGHRSTSVSDERRRRFPIRANSRRILDLVREQVPQQHIRSQEELPPHYGVFSDGPPPEARRAIPKNRPFAHRCWASQACCPSDCSASTAIRRWRSCCCLAAPGRSRAASACCGRVVCIHGGWAGSASASFGPSSSKRWGARASGRRPRSRAWRCSPARRR